MKKYSCWIFIFSIVTCCSIASCKKFSAEVLPMTPIEIGTQSSYERLEEHSILSIPVRYTSLCDSGIRTAVYKVVNNRARDITLVQSPGIPIPFNDKNIDATIDVPVRTGLLSVVVIVYDKDGRMSSKSINVGSVVPSKGNVKTLKDIEMSTDPADNQNFFSMYEATPVFGSAVAKTKQERVDFMLVNMNGGRFISPMAYSAGADYYAASKAALAGFSTISYLFLSSSRAYVNQVNFNTINTDADLTKFYNDSVIAIPPAGNYNVIGADRRISDVFGAGNTVKGFLFGWGYRSHPSTTAAVLNESFGLVLVKSVTKKANGHHVVTFDVKAPSRDQRADYNKTTIAPYDPYPL